MESNCQCPEVDDKDVVDNRHNYCGGIYSAVKKVVKKKTRKKRKK